MISDTAPWHVRLKWNALAYLAMFLMFTYWALVYPFVYLFLCVKGWLQTKLTCCNGVKEFVREDDRWVISAIEGFLEGRTNLDLFYCRRMPTWHPATCRIIIRERGWGGNKLIIIGHRMG